MVIAGLGFGIFWAPVGVVAATWFPAREFGVANTLWVVAPICLVALFYIPTTGAGIGLIMAINLIFGLAAVAVVTLSMGMGQMQPGVNPGNAGILSGAFLTSIGLGGAVFPAVAGTVVERSGPVVSAWLLAAMLAACAVLLALFVTEPAVPEGPA